MSISLFQQLLNPFEDEEETSSTSRTDYSYYLQQQQRVYYQRIKRKKELFLENLKQYEFFSQLDSYLENQFFNSPSTVHDTSKQVVLQPIRFIEPFTQDYETDEYNIIFKRSCVEMREYTRFSIGQMLHKAQQQTKASSPKNSVFSSAKSEQSLAFENEAIKQQFEIFKQEMIQYLLLPNPNQQTKEKLLHFLLDYKIQVVSKNVNIVKIEQDKTNTTVSPATSSTQTTQIQLFKETSDSLSPSKQQVSNVYNEEEIEKSWRIMTQNLSKSNTKSKNNSVETKPQIDLSNTKLPFQDEADNQQNDIDSSFSLPKAKFESNYAQWLLLEQPRQNLSSFVGGENF